MGWKGHKGHIGLPGGVDLPLALLVVIKYRNKQYDYDYGLYSTLEERDAAYDEIDTAISEIIKLVT
jgi:hypothetical protein